MNIILIALRRSNRTFCKEVASVNGGKGLLFHVDKK
jgi:hypothetical protein